ncbi:RimJ/RimL family protein N-acetyltransferase [Allocatelliglobosispora scoriae]|uniref:RimJ/RimL family protein N-acetyltransferase n=1 Tax=Allocatelliglobosispora scoriae TaxID=643052 RepID=A0A841BXT3_9ACTN|nr:GNAT family N-acetyltransferase [Allocatelliglobosispora scoriae]MBB5872346.1 RimJ/RimL family protein N-acetyltransferase [Allocatelliglobosispora scoriae]
MTHTWDGLPIAEDSPRGSSVVVRRADGAFLVLHRAVQGAAYEGDWAWTPPSGARFPGEPVLVGAERELLEEAGLRDLEILPVDISGGWALFTADVPFDTPVTLDHEHDRYEWLPLDDAVARCAPATVSENLTRAAAIPSEQLSFRPLTRDDLPSLVAWRQAPHARQWFPRQLDLAAATQRYGPRIDDGHHVRMDVVLVDGVPSGYMQRYRVGDEPFFAAATGMPEAIGIDYLLGVGAGRGLGARMIWTYLRDVVLPSAPGVSSVIASPEPANVASLRALEKAGFRRTGEIAMERGPEVLCVLDVARVFGVRPAPAGGPGEL